MVTLVRVDTGEAWLVSRLPPEIVGGANVQWGDTLCSVGGYNQTSGQTETGVRCWNPLGAIGRVKGDQWVQVMAVYNLILQTSKYSFTLQVSQMDTRRYMPGAVVMDGKLFVAGGYDPKTHK